MKSRLKRSLPIQTTSEAIETLAAIWASRHKKVPLTILIALCLNLILAPLVYASTGDTFSRGQAWALTLLGLVAIALGIYLFFVMFVPEKF